MALTDIPTGGQPRRLDSWKEIAEYLRRDVRTAMRWESQGLPLHRVAGGRGRSVFAFTNEIDAWMAGRSPEPEAPHRIVVADTAAASSSHRLRTVAITVVCTLAVIAIGAVVVMSGRTAAPLDFATLRASETPTHISIADASGASRVIYRFDPDEKLREGDAARVEDIDADGVPEIVGMVAYRGTQDGRITGSGTLRALSIAGDVRWSFAFDDALTFAGGSASSPWVLTDWQAEPAKATKRIAVAAHEERWWASLVTVLDHGGQRQATFVNPGWIESVMWRSSQQLAIAGFNNERDSAMFALLDADRLQGQAPGSVGTIHACVSCSTAAPLFYATFPRSELNRLTASRFNRARLSTAGDRIIVTTAEIGREGGDATAFYEFDRDLRFVQARYSDLYWSEHRRLELEGRLTHTRDTCPDREGPKAVEIWDAARGWVLTTPLG